MPRPAPYGFVRGTFSFPIKIPAGTAAAEFVTDYVAGFTYVIEKVTFHTTVAATGAGASRVFRVVKGASTVVATRTHVLADSSDLGEQQSLTVTAANAEFSDTDTLTIDTIAAGAVEFTAGEVQCVIQFRQKPQRQTS